MPLAETLRVANEEEPHPPSTPRQVPATQQATSATVTRGPAAPSTPRQVPATQPATTAEQERKARDNRWEALPDAAQDEARARFDQLEPSRKGAPSAQRFEQVVGDVENLVAKTYDREEYQLRERRREWHPTDKNGDELLKRTQIDTFGTDREPVNLRERGAVLDAANILDAADRVFETANRQIEERRGITPSHASVREAAADTASTTTGWLRKVMDAIASGKARPVYDDPGPKGDAHHIALTLYMHAGDDNTVSDFSDLPPSALAAETRTEIDAVGDALFLLEDLGLVLIFRYKITGAVKYMLLRDPRPDDITARGPVGARPAYLS